MKSLCSFLMVILGLAACGQVKEKEVKLELLPEGETNASYSSSTGKSTETETDTETETETDTTTLSTLQTMLVEIEKQRTSGPCYSTASNASGGSSAGCDFETTYNVTDAIVTSVQNCGKVDTGLGLCQTRNGLDWAIIQEIGGGGMLLNTFGWYTTKSTPLKVGDKISFTASKMKYRFGRGYLFKIAEDTLVVSTATAAELFKLSAEVVALDDIDITKLKADNLYRLVSGNFKVSNQSVTVSGDGSPWFALTTKAQPLDNGLYVRGSGVVEKGKCYTATNVPLVWSTTPTAPTAGGYVLQDKATFDTIHATNSLGSITAIDCTTAGL